MDKKLLGTTQSGINHVGVVDSICWLIISASVDSIKLERIAKKLLTLYLKQKEVVINVVKFW